jgi:hypothetical protein
VRAKRHHGIQNMPSASPSQTPLTVPYPPSASRGRSRTLEEMQKPVEVNVLASNAVQSVESRTYGYPYAGGVVITYLSFDTQREHFKTAMFAVTRIGQHEFVTYGAIDSSRSKLRALYFQEQRVRPLSLNAARRRVMHSSKDRMRRFDIEKRLALSSGRKVARLWRKTKKREMFSVWLGRDRGDHLPKERTAHRESEHVRALRDASMKKKTAVRGSILACKQCLEIGKHVVMKDLVRYQPLHPRWESRAAYQKSWSRHWYSYIRNIYLAPVESEDKQRTPLFSLAKQQRRRGKRMLQGHLPSIVKITRNSPALTTYNTITSLVGVLGMLGLEGNFSDVKANDIIGCDKGVYNQLRRRSTSSSLTRFTPSSRLRAQHTSIYYTEPPMSRRDNGQYESANSPNVPTKGSDVLDEGATNNYIYDNHTRENTRQSHDEERENEFSSESDADNECEIVNESDEEPEIHVSLPFQIPEDTLREAMQASPNSQASFYNHRLYRGPEGQMLSVHYCRNIEVAEKAAKLFVDEKVLGFDIEWKPWASPHSIKDNASLIQLASEDRIALFHISLFSGDTPNELLPPTLKTILESPDITKVGVAIKGDFTRLKNHLGVEARGVFEISRLHNIVEHHNSPDRITKRLVSLARQTQQHLQLPLFKGDVRESDWSKQLDPAQLQYAATDAYAGLRIFDVLEAKRKKLRPTPPLPGLCDGDERMHKRAKAPPKSAASKEPEEVPKAGEGIEQEEDTEEYETAPEELMDKHELEGASDFDSTSESPTSNHGDDTVDLNQQDNATFTYPPKTRRVGRTGFSKFKGVDPGYPKLPRLSSESEDSSDAFDPIPQTRPQKHVVTDATLQEASGHLDIDHETGELDDKKLEELMLATGIDDVCKAEEGQSVVMDNQKNKAEQHTTQSTTSTTLEQDEDEERVIASLSGTVPTSNDKKKKKRKPRTVDSRSSETSMSAGDITLAPPHFKPLVPDMTPKSPEYLLAETWAQAYLRNTIPSPSISTSFTSAPSRIRATVPHIRAYHLWHHQKLPLEEVAGHLRDPPLAISTLLSYIAQAVDLERLEYRNEDMRVVLAGLPLGLRMGRYRRLVDRINRHGAGRSGSDVWF